MSITALVAGRLVAQPERRTGQSGKPFTLARIAAATEDGDVLVSVIAFGEAAAALAALGKGDSAAVTGRAKVSTWTGKDGALRSGLSITADAVLTAYQVRQRRAARRGEAGARGEA